MSIEFLETIFDPVLGWMTLYVDDRDVMPCELAVAVLQWLEYAQLFDKATFSGPDGDCRVAARPYGVAIWVPGAQPRRLLCYRYYIAAQLSNGMEVVGRQLTERPTRELALEDVRSIYETDCKTSKESERGRSSV